MDGRIIRIVETCHLGGDAGSPARARGYWFIGPNFPPIDCP
jgi:hypothetical protein